MPRPGRFTTGKDPVPIIQEAGRAPAPVWTVRKISPPPGFDPRTVQTVASRFTDWVIYGSQTRTLFYMTICINSSPRSLGAWRQAAQLPPLFRSAVSRGPCVVVQFIPVTIFQEGAGTLFLWLVDKRHTSNTNSLLHVEVLLGFIN
jgi:hypothetical protein